jgi:hypothetical protein
MQVACTRLLDTMGSGVLVDGDAYQYGKAGRARNDPTMARGRRV